MKLKDFFDSCSAEEMAVVMGELDEELPEDTARERIRQMVMERMGQTKTKQEDPVPIRKSFARRWWKAAAAAAACLCLVTFGAVSVEAREYRDAVEFFQENALCMDGLTRAEVKEVYRDIISETYTYTKTAEVICNSTPTGVKGLEIAQETPDAEDIEALWKHFWESTNCSIHYAVQYIGPEQKDGGGELGEGLLRKYDGDNLLWSVSFDGLFPDGWISTADGVLVWGWTPRNSSEEPQAAWLACVTGDGILRWKEQLSHAMHYESIQKVLDNGDGTYAVFSQGGYRTGKNRTLLMCRYSGAGEELARTTIEPVGAEGIRNAARLGDDYLVLLSDSMTGGQRLIRLDGNGSRRGELIYTENSLKNEFVYTSEDCYYYITDMAEFAGQLYLSAYAVPKAADGSLDKYGRNDIAAVLDYVFDKYWGEGDHLPPTSVDENGMYSGEDLLERMRENFTAVLFVCDPANGTPETFYSVQGSIGGKLDAQEELFWNVESISQAKFSPLTSAWSIWADCQVFRYAFDSSGALLRQEKTEEVTVFAR